MRASIRATHQDRDEQPLRMQTRWARISRHCRRSVVSIAFAIAMHAAVFAALVRVPRSASVRMDPPPASSVIDLDVEPVVAQTHAKRQDMPPTEPETTRVVAMNAGTDATREHQLAPATSGSASETPPPSTSASAAPATVVDSSPVALFVPQGPADIGLAGTGAPNPFATKLPEGAGPSGAPSAAASDGKVRGVIRIPERIAGTGPEGTVKNALRDATSRSLAPVTGRAVFVVRAGENGVVVGLDLQEASGGSGWADAGRLALEAVRGKKVNLPSGARGANIRVEVTSGMHKANGEATGSSGFGARQGDNKMPEMTIPDPANIGAKPTRVVAARVLDAEIL